MKKLSLLAVLLTAGWVAAAATLVNSNFEDGNRGWKLTNEYSIEPLAGRNASRGLYIKRTSSEKNGTWVKQYIYLEPG